MTGTNCCFGILIKGLTLITGAIVEREQLDDALRQQQADTQNQLDVMNEKVESWVCQCFSDLRNRIIELVSVC